jgi:hypothetical protein
MSRMRRSRHHAIRKSQRLQSGRTLHYCRSNSWGFLAHVRIADDHVEPPALLRVGVVLVGAIGSAFVVGVVLVEVDRYSPRVRDLFEDQLLNLGLAARERRYPRLSGKAGTSGCQRS